MYVPMCDGILFEFKGNIYLSNYSNEVGFVLSGNYVILNCFSQALQHMQVKSECGHNILDHW